VVLLKPFGPRLAADALPSEDFAGWRLQVGLSVSPAFAVVPQLASPYLPSSSAGEALPPTFGYQARGPSGLSGNFNPPDTSAVRHTL